jgi:hypothetical protein
MQTRARLSTLLGLTLSVLSACVMPSAARAQEHSQEGGTLISCSSRISLDGRLVVQRWATASETCDRPFKTRVTDRYLGYTCAKEQSKSVACRPYVTAPGSQVFDTSRYFRCVDVTVTASGDAFAVSRLREWAVPQRTCDWTPDRPPLAMEADFDNGRVCIEGLCMAVDRLTAIGKVRLRVLIEKAFRELDLTADARGPYIIGPMLADSK